MYRQRFLTDHNSSKNHFKPLYKTFNANSSNISHFFCTLNSVQENNTINYKRNNWTGGISVKFSADGRSNYD